MNGDDVLGVLKEIRDEAKQTNARLESLEGVTNARFESLAEHEQRITALEKK